MDALVFTKNGVEFVKYTKKQKNTRFSKLQDRAENIEFILEKCGYKESPYEIVSNTRHKGMTICCRTLNEVETEIVSLEEEFLSPE